MNQLLFHNNEKFLSNNPPPQQNLNNLPILTKLNESYKLWHGYFNNLPRHTKFTLGAKIDCLFTECLELTLNTGYAAKENKNALIEKLSTKFDALKFFIKILWEIKALNNQKYSALFQALVQIGKMIGGWRNLFKNTPKRSE